VIGNLYSTLKNPAYEGKKLLLVQRIRLDGTPDGLPTVAVDYVDAGIGDVVLLGAAPGLAKQVFKIDVAPMRELIMGVVDRVDMEA
jgi:ethanolamine utilization protein EutN